MAQPTKPNDAPETLLLKLPHPYLTSYEITTSPIKGRPVSYQILPSKASPTTQGLPPPTLLHNGSISFSDIEFLSDDAVPPKGDNSSWARARRSPYLTISWTGEQPTVPQLWLIAYAVISLHPLRRQRFAMSGSGTLYHRSFPLSSKDFDGFSTS
jgi:hypothetical protein